MQEIRRAKEKEEAKEKRRRRTQCECHSKVVAACVVQSECANTRNRDENSKKGFEEGEKKKKEERRKREEVETEGGAGGLVVAGRGWLLSDHAPCFGDESGSGGGVSVDI